MSKNIAGIPVIYEEEPQECEFEETRPMAVSEFAMNVL